MLTDVEITLFTYQLGIWRQNKGIFMSKYDNYLQQYHQLFLTLTFFNADIEC